MAGRHWLAERIGLIEPVRVVYSETMAKTYRESSRETGRWRVTGPFVPEQPQGAVALTPEEIRGLRMALSFGVPDPEPDEIRSARQKLEAAEGK